jgi:2-keto-4-pentenoate hydratase/2-oxohepta-3-ene-1,7-dioic acid hydratase in catechol pathway
MRFARFVAPAETPRWGLVEGDALLELEGDLFSGYAASSRLHALAEVRLLCPATPSKIVALGTNFRAHAVEMERPPPDEPKIFLKAPSALIGPGEPIRLPAVPGPFEHEAELAVVLGRRIFQASPREARAAVFGYACFNDVTARALQRKDGVFARAKGFDTFAPLGPWLETDVVAEELVVEGWVNGERRQRGEMRAALVSVPEALSFISGVMTLEPGDVVAMGTPAGVGPLEPGDRVEVRIEGIGRLSNPVVRRVEGDRGEERSL